MIKAIIFDMGGVIALGYHKVEKEFKKLYGHPYSTFEKMRIHKKWNKGEISADEFVEYISRRYIITTNRESLVRFWTESYKKNIYYDKRILKLVKKLKTNFKVYCLSNTINEHAVNDKKYQKIFDRVFLSSEIGMRKPNREIYRYVLKCIGYKPEEYIFIDDKKLYIEAAQKMGIICIQYKAYVQLIHDLGKYINIK